MDYDDLSGPDKRKVKLGYQRQTLACCKSPARLDQ